MQSRRSSETEQREDLFIPAVETALDDSDDPAI